MGLHECCLVSLSWSSGVVGGSLSVLFHLQSWETAMERALVIGLLVAALRLFAASGHAPDW